MADKTQKLSDALQNARMEIMTELESTRLDAQQVREEYSAFEGKAEDFEAMQARLQDALRRAQNMEAAQQKMHEIIALLHGAPGAEFLSIDKEGTVQHLSRDEVKEKQRQQRLERMQRRQRG